MFLYHDSIWVCIYVSIYQRSQFYIYLEKKSILNRIKQHNLGIVSVSTERLHLWPYALFEYICGFDLKKYLLFYIWILWKERIDILIINGVNDTRVWDICGSEIIMELEE